VERDGRTLAARMRRHAGDREHLYGVLMRAMADDWDAGGPVRTICRGWETPPAGAVVELRLLAGLFRIVLTGRAPGLVQFYPCLGGTADPHLAWTHVRGVLEAHTEELHRALDVAPQTNEVGRSAALLVGLFDAVRRSGLSRVRLLEPGASAGLNLLVDRFRFVSDSWSFGPPSSPVVLRDFVVGAVEPAELRIVERRGCDPSPIDPTSAEGRLRLRSFVWPFQVERHARLSAALEVARACPVRVDAAEAGQWVRAQLANPPADGVLTVLWQSITAHYWPADQTVRVAEAVDAAAQRYPVAHVSMEYPGTPGPSSPPELVVAGPAGTGPRRLGTVGDHGMPLTVLPT
jgi:hypothetical protein